MKSLIRKYINKMNLKNLTSLSCIDDDENYWYTSVTFLESLFNKISKIFSEYNIETSTIDSNHSFAGFRLLKHVRNERFLINLKIVTLNSTSFQRYIIIFFIIRFDFVNLDIKYNLIVHQSNWEPVKPMGFRWSINLKINCKNHTNDIEKKWSKIGDFCEQMNKIKDIIKKQEIYFINSIQSVREEIISMNARRMHQLWLQMDIMEIKANCSANQLPNKMKPFWRYKTFAEVVNYGLRNFCMEKIEENYTCQSEELKYQKIESLEKSMKEYAKNVFKIKLTIWVKLYIQTKRQFEKSMSKLTLFLCKAMILRKNWKKNCWKIKNQCPNCWFLPFHKSGRIFRKFGGYSWQN